MRIPWRLLIYPITLLYLWVDLKVIEGPLYRVFHPKTPKQIAVQALEEEWVALVNQEPITRRQVEAAVFRHLYQRGKTLADETPDSLRTIRYAVTSSLINNALIRQYADGDTFRGDQDAGEAYADAWMEQFASEAELQERAELQNLTVTEIRSMLKDDWRRKQWIDLRIADAVAVTDDDIARFYQENVGEKSGFIEPEKVKASHIFLATLNKDPAEVEARIREIYASLQESPESFEELAEERSEDLRSREEGGSLGWFSRDRLAKDFTEAVFAQTVGMIGNPFQTKIGWHIVRVEQKEEQRLRTEEEMADEIRSFIEQMRREVYVKQLVDNLKEAARVQLFREVLDQDWDELPGE